MQNARGKKLTSSEKSSRHSDYCKWAHQSLGGECLGGSAWGGVLGGGECASSLELSFYLILLYKYIIAHSICCCVLPHGGV